MPFKGFAPEAIEFYERLAEDNSRAYWQAHRDDYLRYVRDPMVDLTDELSHHLADDVGEVGPFHLFRPYADQRFAKGRPPYKTHQGAYCESEGGAGLYVQLSAEGLMVGAGYYAMAPDQLERFRSAVDADSTGSECAALVGELKRGRFSIGAISELKTAPRGVPKDHPRIELLRRKGLIAVREFGTPRWMFTAECGARIRAAWAATSALCSWLDRQVGPSTLPPDELR